MEQTALRPKPMPGQEPGSGGEFGRGGRFGVARRLGVGRKARAGRTSDAGHRSGPGPGPGTGPRPGSGHRPHAARRRGRRLITLLFGLLFSAVLVLTGVGLGTVSATVIGMSKLADMQKQAQQQEQKQAQAQKQARAQGDSKGQDRPEPVAPPKPPRKEPGEGEERTAARPTLGVEAVDAPGGAGALLVGVHSPGPGHTAGLVRGDVLLAFGKTRIASAKALAAAVAAADPGRNVTVTVRHASGGRQSLSVTPGFVT
ncbi:PDZ domain-containing protein [Streptomyces sp. NPDC054871]